MTPQMQLQNNALYRGLAIPIGGATTSQDILKAAKLDWKVGKRPVQFDFNGLKTFPELHVLVREDNGYPIHTCSDRFHIHQNEEIIAGLAELAKIGDIKITHGGAIEGGARVFLHGSIDRKFDVGSSKKLHDIVRLDFMLSGAHRPGFPSILKAMAMRLWCLNGATMAGESAGFRLTHLSDFKQIDAAEMEAFVKAMIREFETYEQKAKRLMGFKMDPQSTQNYVVELIQPDLMKAIAEKSAPVEKMTAAQITAEVMSKDSSTEMLNGLVSGEIKDEHLKVDRSVKQIIGVMESQPGAESATGTGWNAYNGVTYYVDHVRGRDNDVSVVSALAGPGAKLKTRALELAVDYTERKN